MAKAKTKAAANRKAAKAPVRPAKAPKKAAPAKSSKASAVKPPKAAAEKPVAAKAVVAKAVVAKVVAAKVAAEPVSKKVDTPAVPRKAEPLTLPATTALVAKLTPPPQRKSVESSATRADLPPADGFTLLVDGHFKSCFDDLKGAKAAASELKGRFPMLRVEIYDASKKVRLPA